MALPKQLIIKESLQELKAILKKATPMIAPRIRVLMEIKKSMPAGMSKRALADLVGVNHNSVQNWRMLYANGGKEAICTHNRTGFKPSVFTEEEHLAMEQKLKDPKGGLRGYVELLDWVEKEFNKQVKYNTLLKYSIKNFGSKIKVARKSHINKNEDAVSAFKKTSARPVGRPMKQRRKSSKK
ncbi:MAG TPA: hypothetical protein VIJ75_15650 [Hanamia sp.]